jgi:3-dehydroquinate synthetase
MGNSMAVVRVGVGIGGRVGIGASSGKDVFGLFSVPLLLYRALSVVYSEGVGK